MAHRPDSLPSEHNSLTSLHTPHPVDADHHYESKVSKVLFHQEILDECLAAISSKKDAWSVKAPTEDEMKTSLPANHRSTLTNERPTIRGSVSSTASSFNDVREIDVKNWHPRANNRNIRSYKILHSNLVWSYLSDENLTKIVLGCLTSSLVIRFSQDFHVIREAIFLSSIFHTDDIISLKFSCREWGFVESYQIF